MAKMDALERAQAVERGLLDIGLAAKASGLSVKMIRHYESIGVMPKAARTFANYRIYGPNDVHMLRFIKRARTLGFSMDEIKELLGLWLNKRRSSSAVKSIAGKHIEQLKEKIVELNAMVKTLEHLTRNCHGDERPDCPILEDLSTPLQQ
jgi:Cu(I)-responsive transcriptional regulator